jgi:hypothetical protein
MASGFGQIGDQLGVFLHGPFQGGAELVMRCLALDILVDGFADHVAHCPVFHKGHRQQPFIFGSFKRRVMAFKAQLPIASELARHLPAQGTHILI